MKKKEISFLNNDEGKKRFKELVLGPWEYRAQTKILTKANFSLDLPTNAVEILTYPGDLVLDPFMDSGQTAIACKNLNRQFLGFEISKKYCEVAEKRLNESLVNKKK